MHRPLLIAALLLAAAFLHPARIGLGSQEPAKPLFSSRAELVVLQVVVEHRGSYVPNLPATAFTVFEDNQPQHIEFFAAEDAPATVGLVIDSSGSMFEARQQVAAAAAAFVDTSNPQDDVFALAFNEEVRAALPREAPFTNDASVMHAALTRALSTRGRTALYDAIIAGLGYVEQGRHQRKALVLVSDGGDNASDATFDDVVGRMQASGTVIYTIAFIDPLQHEANPGRLRRIAATTGGEAFEPQRMDEIGSVMNHIARDIRQAYTIGYIPANGGRDGRLRPVRVTVKAPGYGALAVRTRRGYVSSPEGAPSSQREGD